MTMKSIAPAEREPVPGGMRGHAQVARHWLATAVLPGMLPALSVFLITHIALALLTYWGVILFTLPEQTGAAITPHALWMSWWWMDVGQLQRIIRSGYRYPISAAFFPLYPLLSHALGVVLGGRFYLAAMLVANIAEFGLFVVFWRLVALEFDQAIAQRALFYLAVCPMAFFLSAAYTESLFLFCTAATFLALRQRRWWLAGVMGCFAAASRSAGILLVLPFAWEYGRARGWSWRALRWDGLAILFIPLATSLYMLYLWRHFGDPLLFTRMETTFWQRTLTPPWNTALTQLRAFRHGSWLSWRISRDLIDLSATIAVVSLIALGWRRLPFAYTLYSIAALLLVILYPVPVMGPDELYSWARYMLEIFPAFIVLALLAQRWQWLRSAVMVLFPSIFALCTLLFVLHRWML